MKISVAALIVALTALGCASSHHHEADSPPWEISGAGYHVRYVDQGTVMTGRATKGQIYEWHAAAVERAAGELAKYGIPAAQVYATAIEKAWSLEDNCAFFAYGNENLPATGQYLPQSNTIRVCLYCWRDGTKAMIPKDAPSWTIRQDPNGTDHWRWGVLETGGWFPAAAHEIGEVIKGPTFEH